MVTLVHLLLCIKQDLLPAIMVQLGLSLRVRRRRLGIQISFLVENGCEVGSTFVMRDSTYMCDVSWEELTPHFIRGYRAMQHVCNNLDSWMLEIVDGFSSYVNTLEALRVNVISPGS